VRAARLFAEEGGLGHHAASLDHVRELVGGAVGGRLVVGCWRLAVGGWRLAVRCGLWAVGCGLLAVG
jgi:hypothetical protein